MKIIKLSLLLAIFILSNFFLFSENIFAEDGTARAPVLLTLQNFSDLDFDIVNITAKNFNASDIQDLSKRTLFAHSQQTLTLNRVAYPAALSLEFYTSQNEGGGLSNHQIGLWDYVEQNNLALVCHNFRSQSPYYIGCSGNNSLDTPNVTVNVGGILPVSQPLPIPSP